MFVTWQQQLLFVSMFLPWAGKEATEILFFGTWTFSRPPSWRFSWRLVTGHVVSVHVVHTDHINFIESESFYTFVVDASV